MSVTAFCDFVNFCAGTVLGCVISYVKHGGVGANLFAISVVNLDCYIFLVGGSGEGVWVHISVWGFCYTVLGGYTGRLSVSQTRRGLLYFLIFFRVGVFGGFWGDLLGDVLNCGTFIKHVGARWVPWHPLVGTPGTWINYGLSGGENIVESGLEDIE